MINKISRNNFKLYESGLLLRLLSVLDGKCVTILLKNGTRVVGILDTYDLNIKTLDIMRSILQLSKCQSTKRYMIETLKLKLNDECNIIKDKKYRIVKRKFIKLINVNLILNEKETIQLSQIIINSDSMSILYPNNNTIAIYRNIDQIILKRSKSHLKNLAYQKCHRIGNH